MTPALALLLTSFYWISSLEGINVLLNLLSSGLGFADIPCVVMSKEHNLCMVEVNVPSQIAVFMVWIFFMPVVFSPIRTQCFWGAFVGKPMLSSGKLSSGFKLSI